MKLLKRTLTQRLLEWTGVDYFHWKTLVRVSIKRDFRNSNMVMNQRKSSKGPLLSLIIMLVFMSLMFCVFIGVGRDVPFIPAVMVFSSATLMIGMMIMIDYSSVVISPDDYEILSYQPISSRTFLAVKITNILFYVSLLTLAAGFFPWIAFGLIQGFKPHAFLAAAFAMFSCTLSFSLLLVLLYTSVLRYVHPRKLQRALSYLQLCMSFMIFGMNMFIPQMMDITKEADPNRLLWMLYPVTWFIGFIDIAYGTMGWIQVSSITLSLGVMIVLARLATGKMSMSYSERLSVLMDTSEDEPVKAATAQKAKKHRWFFRKGEARVVATLIRNHFRYDSQFRMGVLGIVPLFIFYVFLALKDGGLGNPFERTKMFTALHTMFLYMAYFMFPIMMKTSLSYSESWEASWIYLSSPVNYRRMIASARNYILVYFMIPFTLFSSVFFFWSIPNPLYVLLHLTVLILLAWLFLQMADLLQPGLPFSQQHRKGERSSKLMILMVLAPIFALLVMPLMFYFVYSNLFLLLATIAGMSGCVAGMEKLLHVRLRYFNRPEYSSEG